MGIGMWDVGSRSSGILVGCIYNLPILQRFFELRSYLCGDNIELKVRIDKRAFVS
jgi:hypothetical protein